MSPEILRYHVPQNQIQAFEQAYLEAAEVLRKSPHCLGFELGHNQKDPSTFLVRILWDSEEGHFQGFRRSELFPQFLDLVRPFIPSILEMEHYKTTADWRRE